MLSARNRAIKFFTIFLLVQGLITFMSIHGGTGEIGYVDSIVERAIVPESGVSLALSLTDRRDVSNLFLQVCHPMPFVLFCPFCFKENSHFP